MSLKPKLFVGIDGGINGGISGIDGEGNIIFMTIMPTVSSSYDLKELENVFDKLLLRYELLVMLEDIHIIPISGNKTIAKMFDLFGTMKTFLYMKRISYQIVRASTWQKALYKGIQANDTKTAGIMWCLKKYPKEDFLATPRCKKPHDGITDSVCIANYNRYIEIGGNNV
jgi:hypothetical protein